MPPLPRVPWKAIMYKNAARPKARFTTWLLMLGRMTTSDRLVKWGVQVDPECGLCHQHAESKEHLYVHCEYTRNIWSKMEHWMGLLPCTFATWEQHITWMIANSKGNSQRAEAFRMIYSETVYGIWMERNGRIFEKRSREWNIVVKEIAYVTCVRAPTRISPLVLSFKF
ncbi:uncharacterized protein LOC132066453 [Lycium ferocissimum]|uniref:uncharacterized protein LOC132066453 n=1 Tax=Lycium ferocissimum TaxID=112874 RepID=UPI0028153848|nr:uncharacterized protein LOC132066453 [Lycium ferocissimum]